MVKKNFFLTTHFNWTVLEAQKELEALLEICFSYECLFLVLKFFWSQAATNIPKRYTSDHRKIGKFKNINMFSWMWSKCSKTFVRRIFSTRFFFNRKYSWRNVDSACFLMPLVHLGHTYSAYPQGAETLWAALRYPSLRTDPEPKIGILVGAVILEFCGSENFALCG